MAAYVLFPGAATGDGFIENIKNQAEAYGWTVDFFGAFGSYKRAHIHKGSAHFEIWNTGLVYAGGYFCYLVPCTGYDSGSAPTAQPGVGSAVLLACLYNTLVCVGKSSIILNIMNSTYYTWVQFGYVDEGEKVGSWSGGMFVSGCINAASRYPYSSTIWGEASTFLSQMYINGSWVIANTTAGNGISGVAAGALTGKMPFSYSGGILPVPLLLTLRNATTATQRHPLAYVPDVRIFNGGSAYSSLEEMVIDGETWLPINQSEAGSAFSSTPTTLLRLAS